jgi:anti-sigma factor RsiW
MCNEREKLIGYLYDEGDSSERDAVRQHLETCGECRVEIASLRSVREDLAAWEVPEHGSVWRPFAAAPTPPWWQHVPQWALAAAAGIVLVAGAAGGAVTHAFMPHGIQAVQTPPALATQVSDATELAALQQQIARLRADLGAVSRAPVNQAVTPPVSDVATLQAIDRQLAELRARSDAQNDVVQGIYANQDRYRKELNFSIVRLRATVEGMANLLEARSGGQQ